MAFFINYFMRNLWETGNQKTKIFCFLLVTACLCISLMNIYDDNANNMIGLRDRYTPLLYKYQIDSGSPLAPYFSIKGSLLKKSIYTAKAKPLSVQEKTQLPEVYAIHEKLLNDLFKSEKHVFEIFPEEKILDKIPDIAKKEQLYNDMENDTKKILLWNDIFGEKDFEIGGYGTIPFVTADCEHQNCFLTSDRNRFSPSEIDAIIWNNRAYDKSVPNSTRYQNAKFIASILEPATFPGQQLPEMKGLFDYTCTYRSDSDIPNPSNFVVKRKIPNLFYTNGEFVGNKTHLATWFISNCYMASNRMELKDHLLKYINIDIFGKCGEFSCAKDTNGTCYKNAAKKYFFYFAFENSLCKDYITEKFFNSLMYDMVPVVYGAGPYWKHAPPHSYIDVFDFHSLKELTDYLVYLTKNPAEYNAYFRWKAYYKVPHPRFRWYPTLCHLCQLLNDKKKMSKKTTKYDIKTWFVTDSHCMAPSTPIISKFLSGNHINLTVNQFRKKENWV